MDISNAVHVAKELEDAAARALLDIIRSVPGFVPPEQKRSRQNTYKILSSLALMLQSRSFSEISMQQIADQAGCAVTAIYSRFSEKQSMLAAIHLLLLEKYRAILSYSFSPDRFHADTLFEVALVVVKNSEQFHLENLNFVKAAIIADNGSVYQITESIVSPYSDRLIDILQRNNLGASKITLASLQSALRLVFSVHRDYAMARPLKDFPDSETLARIFTSVVEGDLSGF